MMTKTIIGYEKVKAMIAAVVAVDKNYAIGSKGGMLASIRGDLKMFRELTSGHTILMGRKTFEALPAGPLPDRKNIVISSKAQGEWTEVAHEKGKYYLCSMENAKQMLKACVDEAIFVIGGGMIYRELLPFCQRVYLTMIYEVFDEADTYFPDIDAMEGWQKTACGDVQRENGLEYQFFVYDKEKTVR